VAHKCKNSLKFYANNFLKKLLGVEIDLLGAGLDNFTLLFGLPLKL
jgi:hypothetical protein